MEGLKIKRTGKPAEIALIYGLDTGSLANMRCQRKGPRYYKRGRSVFYFIEDVETWLKATPVETTDSHMGR